MWDKPRSVRKQQDSGKRSSRSTPVTIRDCALRPARPLSLFAPSNKVLTSLTSSTFLDFSPHRRGSAACNASRLLPPHPASRGTYCSRERKAPTTRRASA
ncbi:hypothetical protein PUN28_005110 [Cardiocondyla obscurior]|uniref:Uncharacterized protein n=1 Tax=Cardiocondyla obscurior TaxID=286306 RepID=A0AAW2GFW1_9HYME